MSTRKSPTKSKAPERAGTKPGGKATPAGQPADTAEKVEEIGGRKGPDPTRYGDWEKDGRCIDF